MASNLELPSIGVWTDGQDVVRSVVNEMPKGVERMTVLECRTLKNEVVSDRAKTVSPSWRRRKSVKAGQMQIC